MAGGKACLLHHIFQKTGITPDEFYQKPRGVQIFMLQSMIITLEAAEGGEGSGGNDTD